MQSPTTLLGSIQIMKSKLRSDKQALMDIKNGFTKFNKKSKPPQSNEEESFILADISQTQMNKSSRDLQQIEITPTIIKLKKEHQREMKKLKEQHQQQMNELIRVKALQIEDIHNQYQGRLQEQTQYIAMLEKQLNHSNQTSVQKNIKQQYDKAIKDLLQHNNQLYSDSQQLIAQNQRLRELCTHLQNQKSTKSRFKFSKIKKQQNQSQYQSKITRFRTNSLTLNNDQNINRTNIPNDKQWQDQQINEDQLKLKTIRQLQRDGSTNRGRQEGYKSLKI